MALTLRDITWASLSETRNNRDKIAVSVSERRTYVPKVSAIRLTPAAHEPRHQWAVSAVRGFRISEPSALAAGFEADDSTYW